MRTRPAQRDPALVAGRPARRRSGRRARASVSACEVVGLRESNDVLAGNGAVHDELLRILPG